MQITRQADYAIRTVHYVSRLGAHQHVPTRQIAKEQRIPSSFLAKIISQLAVAGLVQTTRGAHGGVALAKAPKEITLLEVVEAIDGPILLNECVSHAEHCYFGKDCQLRGIWCETQNALVERLRETNFAQFSDT